MGHSVFKLNTFFDETSRNQHDNKIESFSTSPPTSTITPTSAKTTSPKITERTQLDDNVPEPSEVSDRTTGPGGPSDRGEAFVDIEIRVAL